MIANTQGYSILRSANRCTGLKLTVTSLDKEVSGQEIVIGGVSEHWAWAEKSQERWTQ